MMNDDDKMNEGKEITNEEPKQDDAPAEQTTDENGEKKMGKVIPFDPKAETNAALEAAQSALSDAVANMKSAFNDLKRQMAPLAESLREVKTAINESAQNAKSEAEEAAQQRQLAQDENPEDSTAEKAKNATAAAAKEASELLNLGVEKLKKRTANLNFNLKDVISKEFEEYADKNLKENDYVVDENGKRVVKVDGTFVQQHGNEIIPAILRGAVGSFLKAVIGTDPLKDAQKEDAETTDAAEKETAENTANAESKYHVEFDFAEAVGNAIRNAQVSPAPESKEEAQNREQGREILVEGARIVEDSLNGKPSKDAKERLEAAMNRAEMSDADKAPEDIQAIDEKHQKILEMSRQFEKDMNSDK